MRTDEEETWLHGFLYGWCRVTKQVGLGALETFSRGVGDGRYISVMRAGAAPKRVQALRSPSSGCLVTLLSTVSEHVQGLDSLSAISCCTG